MRMDVYDVVKHHVVFGSIVVPGVVFVEMALEATRELFGHGVRITDVWLDNEVEDGSSSVEGDTSRVNQGLHQPLSKWMSVC